MSRLVIPLIVLLLFLAVPVSATYYVKEPSPLYEVKYSVLSNGTDALIHLEVLQWGISCGMTDCWPEVFYGYEYILYFNGPQLYLLNFTHAFKTPYISYKGVTFVNGSWYVEVNYYPPACSTKVDKIYRLDLGNFCIKPVNVSWFYLPKGETRDEINSWEIELQSLGPGKWGQANVSDLWIASSKSASKWSPSPAIVVNSSVFPVYFILRKDDHTKNITLIYLNTTGNNSLIQGFWFPDGVRIVNVTICKRATNITTSTTTGIETTPRSNATKTKTKDICGPGFVVLIILSVLLPNKRR